MNSSRQGRGRAPQSWDIAHSQARKSSGKNFQVNENKLGAAGLEGFENRKLEYYYSKVLRN